MLTVREQNLRNLAVSARAASRALASAGAARRTEALLRIASELEERSDAILAANARDLERGRANGLTPAFLDRLMLDPARLAGMVAAVRSIAAQADPVGVVESEQVRPNGLRVGKRRTPLGVVCVIYEARPNVTSDAAALGIRSGNAMILKGGSDAADSNAAIGEAVRSALVAVGLSADTVVVVTGDRADISTILKFDDLIDLVIPRGGEGLIRFVAEQSRIPVIKHYKGVCHVYVDSAADVEVARAIVVNAKASRPSVCNSAETLLIHREAAPRMLRTIAESLVASGVTLHACGRSRVFLEGLPNVVEATDADWAAEYLSLDLAVRVVDSMDDAIAHIERWGSDHTEAVVTTDEAVANEFVARVASSCVVVNASTRFNDGGELGLGAEIGISTSRLHAYGPMGANELTTTRFVIFGNGQVRR